MARHRGLDGQHADPEYDQDHSQDVERQAPRPIEGESQRQRPEQPNQQRRVEELDQDAQHAQDEQDERDVRIVQRVKDELDRILGHRNESRALGV